MIVKAKLFYEKEGISCNIIHNSNPGTSRIRSHISSLRSRSILNRRHNRIRSRVILSRAIRSRATRSNISAGHIPRRAICRRK